jgi:cysteine synthase A
MTDDRPDPGEVRKPTRQIASQVELIGQTPLLRLHQVADADGAEVWVKCEQYNPGGSVKDRIALAMIEAAEARGEIQRGRTIVIEPTSGNTGIGLALVCASKGYPLVLTMPESMSLERRALLSSYGAKLILTAPERAMEGSVTRAIELCREHADYYMPDQFNNPANPEVHRETTARELLEQLPGRRVDAFVAGVGTGGTITGVGQILRERFPDCRVIALEPAQSPVISGGSPGPHKIQGIGAGFVPRNLDRSVITEVQTVEDRAAYAMAKRLAREEGLLVGISSGANVSVACQVAREMGPGHVVVTVLCDTGERYFSLDEYFQ